MKKYGLGSNGDHEIKQDSERRQMHRKNKLIKCEDCGTDKDLCRHYLDGDTNNYEQGNIIILCKRCRSIHCKGWRFRPIECPVCGKMFTRKRRDRNLVCSVECRGEYISMVRAGKILPDPSIPTRHN